MVKSLKRIADYTHLPSPIRHLGARVINSAGSPLKHSGYRRLYFDIVGFCNAHCPYCTTGAANDSRNRRMVTTAEFADTISLLMQQGIITRQTEVHPYNWGEPLLHPQLNEFLRILKSHDLHFVLSTNASKWVEVDPGVLSHLKHIKFSVPGWSQQSYNRIHGLNFQKVVKNIERYCDYFSHQQAGLWMGYHLYRFSIMEMPDAEYFCQQNGIHFRPAVAYFNGYDLMQEYLSDAMNEAALEQARTDLFLDYIDEIMAQMPQHYDCPLPRILTISDNCDVMTCCAVPYKPEYALGPVSEMSKNVKEFKSKQQRVCHECRKLGITWFLTAQGGKYAEQLKMKIMEQPKLESVART